MREILTITLNPALDLAANVPQVRARPKLRTGPVRTDPGGGGINVSRAIANLGGHSRAFVALGGPTGSELRTRLEAEGITLIEHPAPGATRQSLTITDDQRQQYRFVLPGPLWEGHATQNALQALLRTLPKGGLVVLSGSLPPGIDPDFPGQLSAATQGHADLIIDTSGPALEHLATGQNVAPAVLRMDQKEAEELAGKALRTAGDSLDFAAALVARGAAQTVIIARGAEGSVLAGAGQRLSVRAADVTVQSKVGAGDSFVAGYTLALARGAAMDEALRRGAAAASAAVMTAGTELCRRADAEALFDACPLVAAHETGAHPTDQTG